MTGLVVDIGDGVTHIIPVIEGCSFPHLTRHAPSVPHDMHVLLLSLPSHMLREQTNRPTADDTYSAEHSMLYNAVLSCRRGGKGDGMHAGHDYLRRCHAGG